MLNTNISHALGLHRHQPPGNPALLIGAEAPIGATQAGGAAPGMAQPAPAAALIAGRQAAGAARHDAAEVAVRDSAPSKGETGGRRTSQQVPKQVPGSRR